MVVGEWNRAYLNELQFFPYSTYKDQVDASSGAFLIVARARTFVGAL
jgi:phage terminase large subunit-like protein